MAHVDMQFLFECVTRLLKNECSERVMFRVERKKANSISTDNYVLICLFYQHHKPLLMRKVDLSNDESCASHSSA